MKVLFKLESKFFTEEQNRYLYENDIEIDWNIPAIPRPDELIDIDIIIDNVPSFYENDLAWHVETINYTKRINQIIPVIWIVGE